MRQFNSEDTARWTETALGRQVESLLSGFLLAASPRERHVYLTICHKQLHYRKSKVRRSLHILSCPSSASYAHLVDGGRLSSQIGSNWSEANVASVTSVINDRLSRVIAGQERDDTNLVYMFNMIYGLLAVDNSAPRYASLYTSSFV